MRDAEGREQIARLLEVRRRGRALYADLCQVGREQVGAPHLEASVDRYEAPERIVKMTLRLGERPLRLGDAPEHLIGPTDPEQVADFRTDTQRLAGRRSRPVQLAVEKIRFAQQDPKPFAPLPGANLVAYLDGLLQGGDRAREVTSLRIGLAESSPRWASAGSRSRWPSRKS